MIWGKRLADDVLALTREGCPGVDYWDWHIDNFDGGPAAWYAAIPIKLMTSAPHLKLVLFYHYDSETYQLSRYPAAVHEAELFEAAIEAQRLDPNITFGSVGCHAIKVAIKAPDPFASKVAGTAARAVKVIGKPEVIQGRKRHTL